MSAVPPVYAWVDSNGEEHQLSDPSHDYQDAWGAYTMVTRGRVGFESIPREFSSFRVPGRAGETPRARARLGRDLILPVQFLASNREELQKVARRWVGFLSCGGDDDLGLGELRIYHRTGNRRISCAYVGGLESLSNAVAGTGNAAISFHAFDPYFRDGEIKTQTYQVASDAFYPILPMVLVSGVAQASTEALNHGDAYSPPVWTIVGPGGTITLTLTTKAGVVRTFVWDETNAPRPLDGDSLIIDVAAGSVTYGNDGANAYGGVDRTADDLWYLPPGQSTVDISLSGATGDSSISLQYEGLYESA